MKYRWKLLILLLVISIIPIVSLRTFGIHSVRNMADVVKEQVRQSQREEAENRLQFILNRFSEAMGRSRDQVEMALIFQASEVHRNLKSILPKIKQSQDIVKSDPEMSDTGRWLVGPVLSDQSNLCLSSPLAVNKAFAISITDQLSKAAPIYQAVSEQLGILSLRHYTGLENGAYGVYPCPKEIPEHTDARAQAWYKTVFEERMSSWSSPFIDEATGQVVMAVSVPLELEEENIVGVTSLIVPLDAILESALPISDMPAGVSSYAVALSLRPESGKVGAEILVQSQESGKTLPDDMLRQEERWLMSSDKGQFKEMLQDFAVRRHRIREMPHKGQASYWAYGPLPHQGTAFVFIIPRDEVLQSAHPVLESIRNRVHTVENLTIGFLIFLVVLAIVLALLFSRTVTRPLEALTKASKQLTAGDFTTRVDIKSSDEFRELGRIFNRVGPQLQEHYEVRQSLAVAKEIQSHLLPDASPSIPGLEIKGITLYCDATGGDYFDYLCVREHGKDKLCVAVGDVADHGIPSALLMATARAFLRLRSSMRGRLKDIFRDINREFTHDVDKSGQFMTLFLTRIDRNKSSMEWVTAGHDPAIIYDPVTDAFIDLKGKGLALGVMEDTNYEEHSQGIEPGQIICIGTDGIWEAHNSGGEPFGKERLKATIRKYASTSAEAIVQSIIDAVEAFCENVEQEDDITLVIVKVTEI